MEKLRVIQLGDKFRIQIRWAYFWWSDVENAAEFPIEFDSLEDAKEWINNRRNFEIKVVYTE